MTLLSRLHLEEHIHTDLRKTVQCTPFAFFSFPCSLPLTRLTPTQTPISMSTCPQMMVVVNQVTPVLNVLFHLCFILAGKAPKAGAGVLNQRAGDYNSGQPKAGPTQSTLTTLPSIRNEMHNENDELTPIKTNCGGHISYGGCSGCPNIAPNKQAR